MGIKDAHAFVDYLRKHQKESSFSSYGIGTSSHIAGTIFARKIGAAGVLHVPYKDMTAMCGPGCRPQYLPHRRLVGRGPVGQGRQAVVPLAVSSTEPLPWAPQLPTIASVVKSDYEVVTWHAVFAPRKTPTGVVDLLNREFQKTIDTPIVQKTYREQGFLTYPPATPQEIDAFVKADKARWKGYVEAAGITPS